MIELIYRKRNTFCSEANCGMHYSNGANSSEFRHRYGAMASWIPQSPWCMLPRGTLSDPCFKLWVMWGWGTIHEAALWSLGKLKKPFISPSSFFDLLTTFTNVLAF